MSLSVSSSCHCVGKKGSRSNRPQASWLLDSQVVERPFIKRLLLENLDLFETRPHASVIVMGHGKINQIPCRNTAFNFLKVYHPRSLERMVRRSTRGNPRHG